MSLLECKDITKSFGGIQALAGVSFATEPESIVGIIGPNGAGKTTLFNIITSIYRADSGEIYFDGESIFGKKTNQICKLGISRTFQTPKPIESLTIEQNLAVAEYFGNTSTESTFDPDELLRTFGLSDKRAEYPDTLQLIEQRYLDLGRALMTNPRLVLLDEIMAGLNPTEKEDMIDTIQNMNNDAGVAFLVVEHDIRVIRKISESVIVIHNGKTLAHDTPDTVLENQEVQEAYVGKA